MMRLVEREYWDQIKYFEVGRPWWEVLLMLPPRYVTVTTIFDKGIRRGLWPWRRPKPDDL